MGEPSHTPEVVHLLDTKDDVAAARKLRDIPGLLPSVKVEVLDQDTLTDGNQLAAKVKYSAVVAEAVQSGKWANPERHHKNLEDALKKGGALAVFSWAESDEITSATIGEAFREALAEVRVSNEQSE